MKFFKNSLLLVILLCGTKAFSQNIIQIKSPDKNIVFSFTLTKNSPVYEVVYKGKKLVDKSTLGLAFKEEGSFAEALVAGKPVFKTVEETYELIVGKNKTIHSHYQEVTISLTQLNAQKKRVNIAVRVFNDGVAFRYEFPAQSNWKNYTLTEEQTTFNLSQNPQVLTLFRKNYTTSHEGFYDSLKLSEIKPDTLMDLPTLFQFTGNIYMAITEANLRNYAGMYLAKKNGILTTTLSPLPGQTAIKVKAILPHHTPWRVMMISDRIGALIESNLLTNLNEPCSIKDISWIKPGKTSFHWWNGDIIPDTTFAPGINFETDKYYIDFCARHHIEYHSVIGYGGIAWYKSDAPGYGEIGLNTDVTQTVPSLNMQQVCDYAKQQGVGIHVWVNWKAIYPHLERSFDQFQKWGIKGMMVDFLDRDDQEMVNIQEAILKKAGEHKLFVQFHGAYKPTGMQRTYPNEFTREGTYNYENNKWLPEGISPNHDLNIAFTRLLAGATDYHLGGFRAITPSKFKTQQSRPLMIGTRCHMLAMYVVLESYLAMVCDYPDAYEGQPGFKFIEDVPTSWDETVVPDAQIHEFLTIARRKGTDWFIGTINNTTAKSIQMSLKFLPAGKYTAEIYSDGADEFENPNHLLFALKTVTNADTVTLSLAAGGGHVMRLVKQ